MLVNCCWEHQHGQKYDVGMRKSLFGKKRFGSLLGCDQMLRMTIILGISQDRKMSLSKDKRQTVAVGLKSQCEMMWGKMKIEMHLQKTVVTKLLDLI